MLFTAGCEVKLRSWPQQNTEVTYTPQDLSEVARISLASDNSTFAFSTKSGTAQVISFSQNESEKNENVIQRVKNVTALAFTKKNNDKLGIVTRSGQIVLYNTSTSTITKRFPKLATSAHLLDFNSDDKLLATGGKNGTLVLYNAIKGNANITIKFSTTVSALRFHPAEPRTIGLASDAGCVCLWDVETSKQIFKGRTHATSKVNDIAFSKSSDLLVSVGDDRRFCLHDLIFRECIFRSKLTDPITAVDFDANGSVFALGTEKGDVMLYDVRNTLKPVTTWCSMHNTCVNQLLFSNGMKKVEEIIVPLIGSTSIEKNSMNSVSNVNSTNQSSELKSLLFETTRIMNRHRRASSRENKVEDDPPVANKEMVNTILQGSEELHNQLMEQFHNLHTFIVGEFQNLDQQMDEKWHVLDRTLNVANETLEVTDPIAN